MTGAVVVAGLGAVAGFGYRAGYGRALFPALTARLDNPSGQPDVSKLLEQARQALAQNEPKLAIIFLKNAVSAAPKNPDVRLELGVALLRAGDAVAAERELLTARQYGGSDQRVLPVLFTAMLTRSEGRKLLEQFPAPAKDDTSQLASDTLRARAAALRQTGDLKGAAAALDRALSFDRSAANLVPRAQIAHLTGDDILAMKQVNEALSKSPKDVSALLMKVDLLSLANHRDQALVVANEFVKEYPKSPQALMTRAGLYLQMRQREKAMTDIDASLKLVPNMSLAVYYKALALEQAKDVKAAWDLAQTLPPAFINSHPQIGVAVSRLATDAGHMELGTSILSGTVVAFPKDVDARVRLAARYLQLKDAQRALETLRPMADSSDPRIMVLLAQAYDMQHQYAKSVQYLEKASGTGAGGDPLKRQIAVANLQAGKVDTAVEELGKLNAAKPDDPQTAGVLIAALMQKGDYTQALDIAGKLISAAPKNPYGPLYQGRIRLLRGDVDGAVASFSRAIAIDKKFVPAVYERALALAARGDLKEADADLSTILADDPKNIMAQVKLAQVAMQEGQKEKAVNLLKQATAAHPDAALPALLLAEFDVQQGRFDDAAAVVGGYLNKVPDNVNALSLQGQIQLAAGKPAQAVATFQQLASSHPKSPQIQMLLAAALAKSGNAKDALSAYQTAVQLAPGLHAAQLALIQYALANKNQKLALSAAQNYAEKHPGPASADTLARTYVTLNRESDALAVLEKSQAKFPNGETLVSLAALVRGHGEAKKADAMLADWIAKHPNDVPVRMAYAASQLSADPAAAETQYRAVLKLRPYNADALNNLGWLLQQKNPKEALAYSERAVKIAPNAGAALDTLGWTKWLLNDKAGALSVLDRAHKNEPNNAEITYHLAVALDGNGRRADAKKLLADLLASKAEFADRNAAQALQVQWR